VSDGDERSVGCGECGDCSDPEVRVQGRSWKA